PTAVAALRGPLPRGETLRVGLDEHPQDWIDDADVRPRLVARGDGHELLATAYGALLRIDPRARRPVPGRGQLDRVPEPGADIATARGRRGRRGCRCRARRDEGRRRGCCDGARRAWRR